ncbi:hypothetical protein K435DRAFT_852189 [Dendrothele bispora CBS 962.96]|uniref:Uncharacterized protein n=1 Tax=Dendrothele bispora (strain CBS 962.96) TaxID=1314807 RepID=A0A4S8MK18_DENBC|nr:hypothetical protein K435DRAFT_852187 [Dendrothele bispora CBS 962.96]THV03120.1 hypothetical protein K435DRAFT_852189 [Dendrothele bispora CBS 962.96]
MDADPLEKSVPRRQVCIQSHATGNHPVIIQYPMRSTTATTISGPCFSQVLPANHPTPRLSRSLTVEGASAALLFQRQQRPKQVVHICLSPCVLIFGLSSSFFQMPFPMFMTSRSPHHSSTTSYDMPTPNSCNTTSTTISLDVSANPSHHHADAGQYHSLQGPSRPTLLHAFSAPSSSTTTPTPTTVHNTTNETGSHYTVPSRQLETMTTSSDSGAQSPLSESSSSFSIAAAAAATTVKTEFDDQQQLFVSPSVALPVQVPLRATQVTREMRSMMHSLRLNPFTFHLQEKHNDPSGLTWSGEEAKPLEEQPMIFEWQIEGYQSGIIDEDELFVLPSEEDEDAERMVKQHSRHVHALEEEVEEASRSMFFTDPSPSPSASSILSGSTTLTDSSIIINNSCSFNSENYHHHLTDNGTHRSVDSLDTELVHSHSSGPGSGTSITTTTSGTSMGSWDSVEIVNEYSSIENSGFTVAQSPPPPPCLPSSSAAIPYRYRIPTSWTRFSDSDSRSEALVKNSLPAPPSPATAPPAPPHQTILAPDSAHCQSDSSERVQENGFHPRAHARIYTGTGQRYYHEEDRHSLNRRSRLASSGSRSPSSSSIGHGNAECEHGYKYKDGIENEQRSIVKLHHTLNHPYKFYAYRNTAQSCPNNRTTVPSYSYSYSYHSPPPSSNPSDPGRGSVNCSVSHDHGQRIPELSSHHHNHDHNHNHIPRNMAKLYYPAPVPSGEPLYVHDHHHGNGCGRSPREGCVSYNSPEIGTGNNNTCEVRGVLSNSDNADANANGYCISAETFHHPNPNTSSSASTSISTSVSASPPTDLGPGSNTIFQVGFCGSLGGGVRTGGEGGAHHHRQHQHHQYHQRHCQQQSQQHPQIYRVIVPGSGVVPSSSSTGDPGFQVTAGHGYRHTGSGMYYDNYSQATATATTTTTRDLHLNHGHPQGYGMEVYS